MRTWESFQLSYFSPGGFFPVSLCPQKPQTIQYIFLYIETKNWVPVYFQWSLSILFLNLDKLRWSIPLLTRSFTIWLLTLLGCSTSKFFLQYQYVFKQRSDKKKESNQFGNIAVMWAKSTEHASTNSKMLTHVVLAMPSLLLCLILSLVLIYVWSVHCFC